MSRDVLQKDVLELMRAEKLLAERGGPAGDGQLFEEVIGMEKEILDRCGLPHAASYTGILRRVYEPDVSLEAVEAVIRELRRYGALFQQEQGIAPAERLARAAESHASCFDILPRLGITTHVYTIWVYERLCAGLINAETALAAMHQATPYLGLLGNIQNLSTDDHPTQVPMLAEFIKANAD